LEQCLEQLEQSVAIEKILIFEKRRASQKNRFFYFFKKLFGIKKYRFGTM